jgi:hypothetical protein
MRFAAVVVFALFAVAGCHRDLARPAGYTRISADNHELRDAFDDDADKVRIIMIVSPS